MFTVFITTGNIYAQSIVKGKLTDAETHEAIPFASIIAEGGVGAATDFDGLYEFKIKPGGHTIKFSCISYNDTSITIDLKEVENTINLTLTKESKRLNIVTVVGGKFAKELGKEIVTVEVLGKDMIANNNDYSLDKAMEKVPGVSIVDNQVNIRGGAGWSYGAGSRVLVMVDEVPLLTADAGDVKWSFVPTENVEQVEVVKGAASALYGTGALDGVIDVRTAWPKDTAYTKITMNTGIYQKPRNQAYAWWGEDQPLFGGANFVHRQKFGQVDLVVSGFYSADKSYLQSNSGQDVRLSTKLRWRPKKVDGLSLGVNINAYHSTGSVFFLWNGLDSNAYKPLPNTASSYTDLRATIDPFVSFIDKHENQYKFLGRWFDARNINSTHQGSVPIQYYGEFQYLRQVLKIGMNIVAGAVARFDDVSSPGGVSLVGKHTGTNYGVYAQIDETLFKKLSLSAGIRYEYSRIDTFASTNAKPVLRFGLNYQVAEATFIRASIGQGYRFPSIAEKFVNTNIGSIGIYPNPKLQPETGYSAEIGIKQGIKISKWLGYIDLTGFINRYNNMMEFTFAEYGRVTDSLFGLGFSAQNIGKTRIMGAELTIVGQGKIGNVPVTILGGYTYIDPRSLNWNDSLHIYNSEGLNALAFSSALGGSRVTPYGNQTYASTSTSTSNVLKYRFRHTLKMDIQADYGKFEFGASVNYTSFMENIDYIFVSDLIKGQQTKLNTLAFSALEEYRQKNHRGNTDLSARIALNATKHIKILFIVKNLLNQDQMIRPALMSPPRNYAIQLSVEF